MVFLHPFSGSLGTTVRVKELAISLSNFGVEVYIITPYERDSIVTKNVHVKSLGNVLQKLGLSLPLYRLSRLAYYNKLFVRNFLCNERLLTKVSEVSAKAIAHILERFEIDTIQAEEPNLTIMPCLKAAKDVGIPVVADLHNIASEELVGAGVIKKGDREFRNLQSIMAKMLSQVDLSVVVSEEMKNYVLSTYDIQGNIVVVPPGGRPRVRFLQQKGPPFSVVYGGLVTYREHVDLFVKSMRYISQQCPNARYFVTRKGENLKNIRELAVQIGVEPDFFWYPDENEFYKFLASCHVGVAPSSGDLARKMGTPVKIFDYMSVGLPVVANVVGAWTDMIKDERIGILTDDDPRSFAAGILEFLKNPELLMEYGQRGLKLVKTRFNWDNSAKILFNHYIK